MLTPIVEKKIAALIYLGAPFTTILVVTNVVSDPVNITKLLSTGIIACAIAGLIIFKSNVKIWQVSKWLSISLLLFALTSIWAVINSDAPIQQNIYGSFGRNTGLFAYFALSIIALGASLISNMKYLRNIMYGFAAAGLINIVYCFIAWQFEDPISWNNPYGAILGTFGNPNFISSFLGMVILGFWAYALQPKIKVWHRLLIIAVSGVALAEIISSNSIQGLVVTSFGVALVAFYKIRSLNFKSPAIRMVSISSYLTVISIGGVFALLGALQKGPLAQYIYKPSVSLRGEYWQAGINMALEKPITGVGMDSYGDWYRRARDAQALIVPGPNTVTNAAHSVPIDFLAYGGIPLFIAYLGFLTVGAIALIKTFRRQRDFDWIFVSISGIWLAYHLQSIISINQIGLTIWGWLLTGALVAYERITRVQGSSNEVNDKKVAGNKSGKYEKNKHFSPSLVAGIGAVVGALIFIPPFNADMQWREGMNKGDITQIRKALTSSYLTPLDSTRLIQSIDILEQNKLYDDAYIYAKQLVNFNPDSFDAWRIMLLISKSTQDEKNIAMKEMQRLDPKNKELFTAK
jgi:O-antigen ligase